MIRTIRCFRLSQARGWDSGCRTCSNIEEAAKEGQEAIARAMRTGEEVRHEAQQQAKTEAESLIARARSEIQRERDEAIEQLREGFADITIDAAGKVIDRTLDKKAHRDIIDKVLKESTTLKKGQ